MDCVCGHDIADHSPTVDMLSVSCWHCACVVPLGIPCRIRIRIQNSPKTSEEPGVAAPSPSETTVPTQGDCSSSQCDCGESNPEDR